MPGPAPQGISVTRSSPPGPDHQGWLTSDPGSWLDLGVAAPSSLMACPSGVPGGGFGRGQGSQTQEAVFSEDGAAVLVAVPAVPRRTEGTSGSHQVTHGPEAVQSQEGERP